MMNILTLTMNPAIDRSFQVRHVSPEKKLPCTDIRYDPGGGGINISRVIKRLGGESLAVYLAGTPSREKLYELLLREEVSQHSIHTTAGCGENLIVFEETSGLQYRYTLPGSPVAEEDWEYCMEWLGNLDPAPDWLVASGPLPPGVTGDFYHYLARLARTRGSNFCLDTAGQPLRSALEEGVHLLKLNLRELEELAGQSLPEETMYEEVAHRLVKEGHCEKVVLSLGAAGAFAVDGGRVLRLRPPMVRLVSRIGAGDSMMAAMVLALSKDETFADAVRYGVAAGAATVMRPGNEFCTREDVMKLRDRVVVER